VKGGERAGLEKLPCVILIPSRIRSRLESKSGDERGDFSRQIRSGSGSGSRRWARGIEGRFQVERVGLGERMGVVVRGVINRAHFRISVLRSGG
jgi:hypothetical protein